MAKMHKMRKNDSWVEKKKITEFCVLCNMYFLSSYKNVSLIVCLETKESFMSKLQQTGAGYVNYDMSVKFVSNLKLL
jgi:hypothetical protein